MKFFYDSDEYENINNNDKEKDIVKINKEDNCNKYQENKNGDYD